MQEVVVTEVSGLALALPSLVPKAATTHRDFFALLCLVHYLVLPAYDKSSWWRADFNETSIQIIEPCEGNKLTRVLALILNVTTQIGRIDCHEWIEVRCVYIIIWSTNCS